MFDLNKNLDDNEEHMLLFTSYFSSTISFTDENRLDHK
jgi:hypothetical protein